MREIIDKHGLLTDHTLESPLVLELGCGSNKKTPGAIGIDALDYPDVDIVGDVFDVLQRFPADCVDQVYAYHFIEHVEDLNKLMLELHRIVKPDCLIMFVAPHFSNPYFYSDPTHRRFFGLYTFCYYSSVSPFRRKVPTYQRELLFRLERVDLRFKSPPPFYIRYAVKTLVGRLFNSCIFMKELFEENFCYLFPCYEVCYRLRREPIPTNKV